MKGYGKKRVVARKKRKRLHPSKKPAGERRKKKRPASTQAPARPRKKKRLKKKRRARVTRTKRPKKKASRKKVTSGRLRTRRPRKLAKRAKKSSKKSSKKPAKKKSSRPKKKTPTPTQRRRRPPPPPFDLEDEGESETPWLPRVDRSDLLDAARRARLGPERVKGVRVRRVRGQKGFIITGYVLRYDDRGRRRTYEVRGYEIVKDTGERYFFWTWKDTLDSFTPEEAYQLYPQRGKLEHSYFTSWEDLP